MANTYNASLITDMLAEQAITTLGSRLAPFRAFTTEFGTDRMKPKTDVQIELVTTGATAQTNPTNWESGDTVSSVVTVTPSEYSVSFHVTPDEYNKGSRLEKKIQKNAQAFGNKLLDVVFALLTTTAYSTYKGPWAEDNVSWEDLGQVWAALPGSDVKNLVISAAIAKNFLPKDRQAWSVLSGLPGWDRVEYTDRWSAASNNIVGFGCHPQAIAVGTGLPIYPPQVDSDMIAVNTVTVPGLEITAEYRVWVARATRILWSGYSICLGCAVGDSTALIPIVKT